jgi:hypothetical protein
LGQEIEGTDHESQSSRDLSSAAIVIFFSFWIAAERFSAAAILALLKYKPEIAAVNLSFSFRTPALGLEGRAGEKGRERR